MNNQLETIRESINAVDEEIVKLLAKRGLLVSAAGRHKKDENGVRDSNRVEAVISRVKKLAIKEKTNPNLVENVYRTMINEFINQELGEFRSDK